MFSKASLPGMERKQAMIDKPSNDKILTRKREIFSAAEKVFGNQGYAAATVEEVASEAGLSKGSIYNYFTSKQALFAELFREIIRQTEVDVDALLSQDLPARRKLEGLLDLWFDRFPQFHQIGRLVLEFWSSAAADSEGQFHAVFDELYARNRKRVRGVLLQGERAGEFVLPHGPDIGADLLLGVLDGIELQFLVGVLREVTPEYLAALKHAIFSALSQPRRNNEEGSPS
jgi:AcrR family transcriptional regulator